MPGKNIEKRSFISCTSYFMGKKKTAVLPKSTDEISLSGICGLFAASRES